jgi:hypothetical protein
MALVLLAMLWITKEQKHFLTVKKGITPHDVVKIIQTLIPLKLKDSLSTADIIIRNHWNRRRSRRSKMKKKNKHLVS